MRRIARKANNISWKQNAQGEWLLCKEVEFTVDNQGQRQLIKPQNAVYISKKVNLHKGAQVYVEKVGYGTMLKHIQKHNSALVKIGDKSVLFSNQKIMTHIPITVKIITDGIMAQKLFYVQTTTTIGDLMDKVKVSIDMELSESMQLYHKGKVLGNENSSLKELSINPSAKFLAVSCSNNFTWDPCLIKPEHITLVDGNMTIHKKGHDSFQSVYSTQK